MIGYGPESSHFVIELTYNYGVTSYELGNEFGGITIASKDVLKRANEYNWETKLSSDGKTELISPDGYKFIIEDDAQTVDAGSFFINNKNYTMYLICITFDLDPVRSVSLSSSNIAKTIHYWNEVLNMNVLSKDEKSASFSYDNKFCLNFHQIGNNFFHTKLIQNI